MSTELALFSKDNVPAHVAGFLNSDLGKNIEDRVSVPALLVTGKVWAIKIEGTTTKIERMLDGERVPVPIFRTVILDYAKRRGRSYYAGSYNPDSTSQPDCWSDDGVAPDASAPETFLNPQGHEMSRPAKCADCPLAAKGSKIVDGKEMIACSQHRMLAVVPGAQMDYSPLRLKLAITSDYDKDNAVKLKAENWYAFQQYLDLLKANGVTHTGVLVTKMKFDPDASYPKVLFSPDRWLTEAEIAQLAPVVSSENVQNIINRTYTVNGGDGVARSEVIDEGGTIAGGDTPKADTAAQMQAKLDADKAAKAKAEAEAKKKAEAAAKAAEEESDDGIILPGTPSPAADAAKPAAPATGAAPSSGIADADVEDLIGKWGD